MMSPKKNYIKLQIKEWKQFVKTRRKIEIKLFVRLKIIV